MIELGVDKRTAEQFAESSDNTRIVVPEWQYARAEGVGSFALLFLPCDWTELAHLYAMNWSGKRWHATDNIEMDCHYDDSVSFEVGSIRSPRSDEVIVHHSCEGHGTGYLEQEIQVLAIRNGKFATELKADEVLHSHPTAVKKPRDLDQSSTFTVIPISSSTTRAIEETRSSTLNGHLTVERRIFRWDPAKGRYRPSPFSYVESVP
ncbi:MAG TPA: hypothetical protein VG225_12880 [Terracidiphilus sp.]|nr:hypothetical protein [Terracidiphilus sp.]